MRTIKIRIAVAVDDAGKWAASGGSGPNGGKAYDPGSKKDAIERNEGGIIVWVDAEIPVPDSLGAVSGEVVG
jgi:hypothetical protein